MVVGAGDAKVAGHFWALKQLVVPWVNPILPRYGNGAAS